MQKVFLALLVGVADDRVLGAVRAILDFIYLSQLHRHTSDSLTALQSSLDAFHANKTVFIELEARLPEHFNISKIHKMLHYPDAIPSMGSADGFNTEAPERLHIDYAKAAYRASNRRNYVEQMTVWLRRQEAVDRRTAYLDWVTRKHAIVISQGANFDEEDDEEDATAEEVKDVILHLSGLPLQRHQVAKHSPFPNTTLQRLETEHGALQFIPALSDFIKLHFH